MNGQRAFVLMLCLAFTPVYAEEDDAAEEFDECALEEVVVTGTRTQQPEAPATTATTPEMAAPQTPTSPASGEAPAAPAAQQAEASAEPAPSATPDVPVGPEPVAGVDYVEIAGGQPFEPAAGKIEVAEAFSYTCPHCAQFEPMVLSWRARQPADVKFTPVAGFFGGNPEPFAKAFYAAQALGLLGRTH